jgi:hypothetical protein
MFWYKKKKEKGTLIIGGDNMSKMPPSKSAIIDHVLP